MSTNLRTGFHDPPEQRGIIHQDVELARMGNDSPNCGVNGCLIGDVHLHSISLIRDVVLQFDGASLLNLRGSLPELSELKTLFELAQRGIEFTGTTARDAAVLLESIGQAQGLQRLIQFLDLLGTLARAPKRDIRVLASAYYSPSLDARSSERINQAFDYLINELTSDLRLSVIAERVGMSEAGFSRFFKRITGHGFIDLMRKLRIQRACRLLVQTRLSVAEICFEVGYENVSNFNRHFRHEMDQTPSDYRRTTAVTLFNRDGVHQSLPIARER